MHQRTRLCKVTYDRSREILTGCLKTVPIERRCVGCFVSRLVFPWQDTSGPRVQDLYLATLRTVAAGAVLTRCGDDVLRSYLVSRSKSHLYVILEYAARGV